MNNKICFNKFSKNICSSNHIIPSFFSEYQLPFKRLTATKSFLNFNIL